MSIVGGNVKGQGSVGLEIAGSISHETWDRRKKKVRALTPRDEGQMGWLQWNFDGS